MKTSQKFIMAYTENRKVLRKLGMNMMDIVLYESLRDRERLSIKNNFVNEEGRTYIYYTLAEIEEEFGFSSNTASKYLNALKSLNLVEFEMLENTGFKKIRRIYVNRVEEIYANMFFDGSSCHIEVLVKEEAIYQSVTSKETYQESVNNNPSYAILGDGEKDNIDEDKEEKVTTEETLELESEGSTVRDLEDTTHEIEHNGFYQLKKGIKAESIYLKYNPVFHTQLSLYSDSQQLENILARNINYVSLVEKYEPKWVDYLLNLMKNLFIRSYPSYMIQGECVSIDDILMEILKLREEHIDYLLMSMQRTTTEISYRDNYFISALYSINKNLSLDRRPYYRAMGKYLSFSVAS